MTGRSASRPGRPPAAAGCDARTAPPGAITRIRRGRGFSYRDAATASGCATPRQLLRIKELAIPPAWEDVWICPDPLGHLQATGVDAAGRKQYLYHPRWREKQDREKFDAHGGLRRGRCRACAGASCARCGPATSPTRRASSPARSGCSTSGCSASAPSSTPTRTAASGWPPCSRSSVTVADGELVFDYLAKGGVRRVQAVQDPPVIELVSALKRRRGGGDQLLAYKEGRRWHDVRSEQINEYLKEPDRRGVLGQGLPDLERDGARRGLARGRRARGHARRRRASARSTGRCAGWPRCSATRRRWPGAPTSTRACSTATCPAGRSAGSWIGSDRCAGPTTAGATRLERAVLDLLDDDHASAAVERFAGNARLKLHKDVPHPSGRTQDLPGKTGAL